MSDPTNRCEMFEDYPVEIMRATGQLIDGEFPLICGGTGLKTIRNFTYSKHEEQNIGLSQMDKTASKIFTLKIRWKYFSKNDIFLLLKKKKKEIAATRNLNVY